MGVSLKNYKVFAINPGSTSTKIAIFIGEEKVFSKNVSHDAEKLKEFKEIREQLPFRMETIWHELDKAGVSPEGVDAFSAINGGLVGCEGGVYELADGVNEILLEHSKMCFSNKHPNTLGSQIAVEMQKKYGGRVFIVNPPDVDEMDDVERITGFRDFYRESAGHPLNQKENCIRYANSLGKTYEDLNLIVCHMGGGVTVGAHRNGRLVTCNSAMSGDGPMAPTRSGWIPATKLLKLCFSGEYTEQELYDRITKNGGFTEHLGTSDGFEIEKMLESGDKYAKLVYDAFIYQIAKAAGGCAAALRGKVDAIILTGGLARDKYLVAELEDYLSWIAPLSVQAGEFEMEALAAGAIRAMNGSEKTKIYSGTPIFDGFDHLRE